MLRKDRTSLPARFVGDNNDFSFTTGVSTRDVRLTRCTLYTIHKSCAETGICSSDAQSAGKDEDSLFVNGEHKNLE